MNNDKRIIQMVTLDGNNEESTTALSLGADIADGRHFVPPFWFDHLKATLKKKLYYFD